MNVHHHNFRAATLAATSWLQRLTVGSPKLEDMETWELEDLKNSLSHIMGPLELELQQRYERPTDTA